MDGTVMLAVLGVAILIERVLEAFGEPIWAIIGQYLGKVDANVKRLVSMLIGSAAGWATGINGFPVFERYPIMGYIATALLIGAGSEIVHAVITLVEALKEKLTTPA